MQNEVYNAIFGRKIGPFWIGKGYFFTEGAPCQVQFDYKKVLEREQKRHDLLGFYHTHPNMSNQYSSTDYHTMESWCDATGKPLFCLIEGSNGLMVYDCKNYLDQVSIIPRYFFEFTTTSYKVKRIGKWFIIL